LIRKLRNRSQPQSCAVAQPLAITTLNQNRRPTPGAIKPFQLMTLVTVKREDVSFLVVDKVVAAFPAGHQRHGSQATGTNRGGKHGGQ
jgi:hypothetical protein